MKKNIFILNFLTIIIRLGNTNENHTQFKKYSPVSRSTMGADKINLVQHVNTKRVIHLKLRIFSH